MLASDIIYLALRRIGHLRAGYTAQTELMTDAISEWTAMYDQWQTDGLMSYSNPDYTYTVAGAGSQSGGNGYTIGPTGADLTGVRPLVIKHVNVVLNPTSSTPVYIPLAPLNQDQWADLAVRQIPAINLASGFWYDPQYPNGVLNLFPPITAGTKLEIFQRGILTAPANSAITVTFPPGYQEATIAGLAERMYYTVPKILVPEKVPYTVITGKLAAAKAALKLLNRTISPLANDFQGQRGSDIAFYDSFVHLTGEPY